MITVTQRWICDVCGAEYHVEVVADPWNEIDVLPPEGWTQSYDEHQSQDRCPSCGEKAPPATP